MASLAVSCVCYIAPYIVHRQRGKCRECRGIAYADSLGFVWPPERHSAERHTMREGIVHNVWEHQEKYRHKYVTHRFLILVPAKHHTIPYLVQVLPHWHNGGVSTPLLPRPPLSKRNEFTVANTLGTSEWWQSTIEHWLTGRKPWSHYMVALWSSLGLIALYIW